jgi:hypothetical protein
LQRLEHLLNLCLLRPLRRGCLLASHLLKPIHVIPNLKLPPPTNLGEHLRLW